MRLYIGYLHVLHAFQKLRNRNKMCSKNSTKDAQKRIRWLTIHTELFWIKKRDNRTRAIVTKTDHITEREQKQPQQKYNKKPG